MSIVCIMQPQFFPWIGLFEQIKLADIFVFGDDFKLPGNFNKNFYNRVEIKTAKGVEWLTVPLDRQGSPSSCGLINEMKLLTDNRWKTKHLKTLQSNYSRAPFFTDMLTIVEKVYNNEKNHTLSDLTIDSILQIAKYYELDKDTEFILASTFKTNSQKTDRVIDILDHFNTTEYITGRGALDYLDLEPFRQRAITVSLMEYKKKEYPQLFGAFTPYASTLDLIANMGKAGSNIISPLTRELQ